jgi:hypothetical protein
MQEAGPFLTPLSTLGIGSVPFSRGENSCRAIFERWDIPFWPQYPASSLRENFVFQFLSTFPGFDVLGESLSFDESKYLRGQKGYESKLDRAFSTKDFLAFEPHPDWALGYSQMRQILNEGLFPGKRLIKLQVTGAGTVWRSFFSDRVSEKISERLRGDLSRTLIAFGLAQILRTQSYKRTPLIFIDEPVRSKDLSELSEMVDAFKNFGAWVGLHVCSSSDWKGFEDLAIDLFHFDATTLQFNSSQQFFIQTLLERGGWIVWGIVPTAPDSNFEVRDFSSPLLDRIKKVAGEKLPIQAVLKRSLIAPACGTGTLSPAEDEVVRRSLNLISKGLRARQTPQIQSVVRGKK